MKIPFTQSMLGKVLLLAALLVLLVVPLAQIGGLVHDRGQAQAHAARELEEAHARPQQLAGPVLVVPFTERWTEMRNNVPVPASRDGVHIVFPSKLRIEGTMAPQVRYRGIFEVLFYVWSGQLSGEFPADAMVHLPRLHKNSETEPRAPVLAIAVTDPRGIQGLPVVQIAGEASAPRAGVPGLSPSSRMGQGVHAPVGAAVVQALKTGKAIPFAVKLDLLGHEKLGILPLADDTTARMTSAWPHPGFGGQFLPVRREVAANGFSAEWSVTSLVTPVRGQLLENIAAPADAGHRMQTFDVSLVQPLSPYSLTHRAVHYGALFIGLVLMAAFMFELFLRLRLHPVQYALVGLSIALFFLLLLAGSEKVAFGIAYAAAACASVVLLAVYFAGVLRSLWRGLALGAYVGLLYAALYGLLLSEDNALLLGSLLAFGMLAVLMLATRKVDWYALTARPADAPASA
jgi:inner membrane protein